MDIFHFTPQIHFSSFILHSYPGALGGYPYGPCQQFPFPPFLQWVLLVEDIGKRSGEQEESQVRIFILHLLCGAPQLKATLLSDGPLPTAHFLGSCNHFLPHLIRLGCQVVRDSCSALWSFSWTLPIFLKKLFYDFSLNYPVWKCHLISAWVLADPFLESGIRALLPGLESHRRSKP